MNTEIEKQAEAMQHLSINFNLMSPDVWGAYYNRSNVRRKRRIMAKQGKLLTKQGRVRKV